MPGFPIILREEITRQLHLTCAGAGFLFCIVGFGGVYNFVGRLQSGVNFPNISFVILTSALFLIVPGCCALQLFALAFFKPDKIWRIDDKGLSCQSRNILGYRQKMWPLSDLRQLKIEKISKRSGRYCVEIILPTGKSLQLPSQVSEAESRQLQAQIESLI